MTENETVIQAWIESFIKFLVAEKDKPGEMYRRMCDVCKEAYFVKCLQMS